MRQARLVRQARQAWAGSGVRTVPLALGLSSGKHGRAPAGAAAGTPRKQALAGASAPAQGAASSQTRPTAACAPAVGTRAGTPKPNPLDVPGLYKKARRDYLDSLRSKGVSHKEAMVAWFASAAFLPGTYRRRLTSACMTNAVQPFPLPTYVPTFASVRQITAGLPHSEMVRRRWVQPITPGRNSRARTETSKAAR